MVPDYSKSICIYENSGSFNQAKAEYRFRASEGGAGPSVLSRSHQWLQYWATDPKTKNWTCYYDYDGAAYYEIPADGFLFFSYYQTSFYTGSLWQDFPEGKTLSFACWLLRNGKLAVKCYQRSGNYGEYTDEVFLPVAKGDVIYYGVLNKGDAMPEGCSIVFHPALIKK